MKKIIGIILLISLNIQLFANGGPIDGSAVVKTGRIKMMNEWGIRITSEIINIKIDGNFAVYDITYKFYKENDFNKDTITYGFPVDFSSADEIDEMGYYFKDDYISYFKMFFQNKEIPIEQQIDFGMETDSAFISQGFYGGFFNKVMCKRKWYISKMNFNKKGFYELKVQYKVKNYFSDWLYSKSFLPIYSKRFLKYDLTPAAYWDNGVIDTFQVNIDVSNLASCFEIYNLFGLSPIEETNGILQFHQNNFEINSVKYFKLDYSNSNQSLSKYIYQKLLPFNNIKSVKTKGKNEELLFDKNFLTSFLIKENQSIELDLGNAEICAIYLLNGDYSNFDNYQKHDRASAVKLTSNFLVYDDFGNSKKLDTIINLKNFTYKAIDSTNFAINADLLWDFGDTDKDAKITITFLTPFTKNDDYIYVSELIFARNIWTE